ncbi:MAG TPA: transporter [Thermoanaerobaculia bacterium]|nr:transporter [Thermoanaerobaculia bacterium]
MARRALAAALFLFAAGAADGRPIRTNTPGTGVFIGSGLLLQVLCDQRSGGAAELSSCSLITDFRYTPGTDWAFGVRIPLVLDRSLEVGGRELSDSGLGDVEISGKWRFFRQVGPWFDRHAAVELGVELPTGDSDLPAEPDLALPLAHSSTPGTGSTDLFVDLVYQQGQRRIVWGGDLLYHRNGSGEEGYRFGDVLRLNLDFEYILLPRVYTRPGKELFVLLEPSLIHRRDDEVAGRELPTGGIELLLAPGLQYIATEQMLVSLSVQLPVWSDLRRDAFESDWNVLAEIRYAF